MRLKDSVWHSAQRNVDINVLWPVRDFNPFVTERTRFDIWDNICQPVSEVIMDRTEMFVDATSFGIIKSYDTL